MTQEKADHELFARLSTLHPDERRHLLKLLENGGIMECSREPAKAITHFLKEWAWMGGPEGWQDAMQALRDSLDSQNAELTHPESKP